MESRKPRARWDCRMIDKQRRPLPPQSQPSAMKGTRSATRAGEIHLMGHHDHRRALTREIDHDIEHLVDHLGSSAEVGSSKEA